MPYSTVFYLPPSVFNMQGRERRNLLRAYFSFLHALVHNDLAPVLCDANNWPLLDGAMGRLLQVCITDI